MALALGCSVLIVYTWQAVGRVVWWAVGAVVWAVVSEADTTPTFPATVCAAAEGEGFEATLPQPHTEAFLCLRPLAVVGAPVLVGVVQGRGRDLCAVVAYTLIVDKRSKRVHLRSVASGGLRDLFWLSESVVLVG